MSFANMWTSITEDQEKQIRSEFYMDMALLVLTVTIIELIKQYDRKGCGIPLREWLLGFFILYFSRSLFQLAKIYVVRHYNSYKFHYDCCAFILANGSMAIWLYYGYDMFYSDKNDCDNFDSTAFLNSLMFVILFLGYFLCFVYLMILFTLPCLYMAIRDQAESNRIQAGGVV